MLSVVRFPLDWLKDQYLVPSSSSIDFLILKLFYFEYVLDFMTFYEFALTALVSML